MTDRNDGRPRHSASHMHCAVPFFCARSGTEGEAAWRCGEWGVRSAGNASRSLRACVGVAWGSGSAREGRVAVWGGRRASAGASGGLRRGMHRAACGRASALRGERKCSGRACRCAGGVSEDLRRGMGGEVGGFNAHSPQQHARTCIIIYTSALSAP